MGGYKYCHSTSKTEDWTSFAIFAESEDWTYELSYGRSLSDLQQYSRKQYSSIYCWTQKLVILWKPQGAASSAAVYSIVETAKANGLNPHKYLQKLLEELPQMKESGTTDLELVMPWNDKIRKTCS